MFRTLPVCLEQISQEISNDQIIIRGVFKSSEASFFVVGLMTVYEGISSSASQLECQPRQKSRQLMFVIFLKAKIRNLTFHK